MDGEQQVDFDINGLARTVTADKEQRMVVLRSLPLPERSAVFNILSPKLRQAVLEEMSFTEALELLDHLDPLRVHQVLSRMKDQKRKERFVSRLKSDRYEKLEYFLCFHPDASIALVHLNYVYLSGSTTIGDSAAIIEDHLETTGKVPAILVSEDGKLSGEVSLGRLVRERNQSKLRNFVKPVSSLPYNAPREQVLALFLAEPHGKVVVMDLDGSVLGVIYSDDVIDLLDSQPASTLYSFAAVESSERPFDGVWDKVRGRYRWLLVNLVTCFAAAGVVKYFEGTIDALVMLAVFMPIVGGMASNAATQTLAVMVRGIAVGEIDIRNCRPAIVREALAGGINGLAVSLIMIPVALIFGVDIGIVLIAAASVIATLVVAGSFGSLTPLVLKRLGKDPATSAGIIISTATDVCGYLFLLGAATWLLL